MNVLCSDGKMRKARLVGLPIYQQAAYVSVNGKSVSGVIHREWIGNFYSGKLGDRMLFVANYWGKNAKLLPEWKLEGGYFGHV